jgi:hypothetical protein
VFGFKREFTEKMRKIVQVLLVLSAILFIVFTTIGFVHMIGGKFSFAVGYLFAGILWLTAAYINYTTLSLYRKYRKW